MSNIMNNTLLVTGGAGFIGSNLCSYLIENTDCKIVCVDSLTYAGSRTSVASLEQNARFVFKQVDIADSEEIANIFDTYKPRYVMHLAAESHVDRSISGAAPFIETNIVGTFSLLQSTLGYWEKLTENDKKDFRFLHVSTDEVYGALGDEGLFTEETPYSPNSPYSASKAASDHLANAWFHTYGLPVIISNCSNNYGPYQFPEKLIPLMITTALSHGDLPVYGTGLNVRDWLHVQDHCSALWLILTKGRLGEKYNVGGENERTNLEVVNTICDLMSNEQLPAPEDGFKSLITFVGDRKGHDFRYAIDAAKLTNELGWKPKYNFDTGMEATIKWYLDNKDWWRPLKLKLETNSN